MIMQIRHTGLVVADLEVALHFWRDLLGFTVARQMEESGPHIDAMMGLKDVRLTTSKLTAPEGGMIELDEAARKAIDNARALTVAMIEHGWGTVHVASSTGEFFLAKESGHRDRIALIGRPVSKHRLGTVEGPAGRLVENQHL